MQLHRHLVNLQSRHFFFTHNAILPKTTRRRSGRSRLPWDVESGGRDGSANQTPRSNRSETLLKLLQPCLVTSEVSPTLPPLTTSCNISIQESVTYHFVYFSYSRFATNPKTWVSSTHRLYLGPLQIKKLLNVGYLIGVLSCVLAFQPLMIKTSY